MSLAPVGVLLRSKLKKEEHVLLKESAYDIPNIDLLPTYTHILGLTFAAGSSVIGPRVRVPKNLRRRPHQKFRNYRAEIVVSRGGGGAKSGYRAINLHAIIWT